jgi:hypothetical protein
LIVRNLHYNDGYKGIILLKILQEEIEKNVSYKITKPQVKTALDVLKKNEQITMEELVVDMKNTFSGNYDYKVIEIQRKANRK